jgi:hypothetical protein
MNKLEAWTITIIILAVMMAIPTSVYRWALLLLALPLVGLVLVFI